MAENKTCPHCGKPVPPTALGDLCPECMLQAGLATQTEGPGGTGPHGTKVVHPPPSLAEIAALFPQLEILECLGRGGMGVVYKARQPRLNRFVALKILAREKEQDAQFAERFTREAQALARLNHPNIVTVHDFGYVSSRRGNEADVSPSATAPPPHVGGHENTPEGHCYLVMEFVDGLNLRQLLQARKMPSDQALTIVPKICEALQYAHEQGIVHRDIKPENILLDKTGRVKIADFGIAKVLGDEPGQQTLTGAKDAVGTPHYMAPEQIEKPLSVDHRADIYSLGVVFYEMLTGELPLGKFAPPSQKVQVDVRLDEVVLHALEKEPERRYQQASQVKSAVETIVTTPGGAGPANQNEPGTTAAQIEAVRASLKVPARGLVAAGVLQMLFALGLLIFALPAVAHERGGPAGYLAVGFGAVVFMLFATIVLRGAASIVKLRSHAFCIVASVVAAVAGPGALLGLPFGVWALVVLNRPEVRNAFEANRQRADRTAPASGDNQGRSASAAARSFRRGAWVGFLVFLLVVAAATVVTMLMPTVYVATARVRLTGPESVDPYHLQTEVEIIQSQTVLEPVADSLNLSQRWGQKFAGVAALSDDQTVALMKRMIDVRSIRNTALVEIGFHSDSPAEAAEIANKITETYCALPPALRANIIERAMVPSSSVRPNVPLNIFLGVVGGGFIGFFVGTWVGLISFWRMRTASPPHSLQPDRFWRHFGVTVAAILFTLISIPIFIVMLTMFLPAFNKLQHRMDAAHNQSAVRQIALTHFFIGQTWFPQGDSIEINSVERTADQMVVKGHYNLVSHGQAPLAFYITSTNQAGFPEDAKQTMIISKGRGDFELVHPRPVRGLPHVSMYADGHPFASLYFGTQAEALEESKAGWITNGSPASVTRNPEPEDLRAARAKLAELRLDYSEQSPAVQEALARVAELERMSREEPNAPGDLREAKAHLAELRLDYSEQSPTVQGALARVNELERMSKEEPNAPADLRRAKADLAELRVDYAEQNPRIQEALARIKVLEASKASWITNTQSGLGPMILKVTVQTSAAYVYGETRGGGELVLTIGNEGLSWSNELKANTTFGAVIRPDHDELGFDVSSGTGPTSSTIQNRISLAPVGRIPRGQWIFHEGTYGPKSQSIVIADLVPEDGGLLPVSISVRNPGAGWHFAPSSGPATERILNLNNRGPTGILTFDPMTERILNLNDIGLTEVLDLDSGNVVPPPKLKSPLDASFTSAVMPSGVAIILPTAQHPMMLLGRQTSVAPLPEQNKGRDWDEMSPQLLTESYANGRSLENSSDTASAFGDLPNTFMFKTLAGRVGLLQITGFTENPRGVKIRYKLVQPPTTTPAASSLQFRLVLPNDATAPADWLPSASSSNRFYLSRQVLLDETAIARAGVDFDPFGKREIEIRFTDAGAREFESITATNVGHHLAIVFRGRVLSAPVIQSVIAGNQCQINGLMNASEANEIVDCLNRVATPAAEAWSFSRVQERILPLRISPDPLFGWLNLASGTVFTNATLMWESRTGYEWIRTNGLDVVTADSAKHFPTLLGFDMVIAPAPTNGWDSITTADVANSWTLLQVEPRQMQSLGVFPGESDTFLFQTRQGRKGVLQVLGFVDNLPGVKIRYKLVQQALPRTVIDPTTGLPLPAGATNTIIDPATGLPVFPGKSGAIDPATGLPMTSPAAGDSTDAGIAASTTAPLSYQWYLQNTNPPATDNRVSFGPVIEQTIYSSPRPPYDESSYLDLDTGQLLSLGSAKPPVDPFNVEQFYDWRQKSGADVAAQILKDSDFPQTYPARLKSDFRGLVGLNTVLLPMDKSAWENMSPQAVIAAVVPVKPDTTRWTMATTLTNGLPATHLFKTAEGGMGILQILGFSDNPPGVKLRYKLIVFQ